jgi:hypothetical protein
MMMSASFWKRRIGKRVPESVPAKTGELRIPNIFHFCFALTPNAPFGFLEYLAIKSAYEINRPSRILLHYQHECTGPWWDKAAEIVTLNRVDAPQEIFGNPLLHFAHQSDVIRLQSLLEHGGIYLDIDTLCVRPFTDLLTHECVMGTQWLRGLCNAVILSEPKGVFLSAWMDQYRWFRSRGGDKYWDEHSVRLPRRLARKRELRSHITILNNRAFFFPLWGSMHHLFVSEDERKFKDSYCIHYWESITRRRWLSKITPDDVYRGNSNFAKFARRVL